MLAVVRRVIPSHRFDLRRSFWRMTLDARMWGWGSGREDRRPEDDIITRLMLRPAKAGHTLYRILSTLCDTVDEVRDITFSHVTLNAYGHLRSKQDLSSRNDGPSVSGFQVQIQNLRTVLYGRL